MKRFLLLTFALMAVALFLMPACSDDNDELVSISGSWTNNHSVTDVPIRLTFDCCDGSFRWEPAEETEEHTPSSGSYTFDDSVLTIFDDDDCPEQTGVYSAIIEGDVLEITVQDDECDPRVVALSGTWTRE
jgi:hypothetical protein